MPPSKPQHFDLSLTEKKRWFNPEMNLGHALTIFAIVGGMVSMYVNIRTDNVRLEIRVTQNEKAIDSLRAANEKLADNQSALVRQSDRLTSLVEWLTKGKP